jgi:beta-alanine--pyruvate transaminase
LNSRHAKARQGTRANDVFVECFRKGLLIRVTGDIIALSPPLIIATGEIERIVTILADALNRAV